jgi:ribA/ribD-fused uncharacterized protein
MDQLFFYNKSAHKPAGAGVNEHVVNPEDYLELNAIHDWRKVLSNFYASIFQYDGKSYLTVEHAFQSKKISLVDKEKADWFSVESGHEIGATADGAVARKHRKLVMLDSQNIEKWNQIKKQIMKSIIFCKFTQVPLANRVLLLTRNANLLHGARFVPVERQFELEFVRQELRESRTNEK